jgi:hypothetical protein
LELGRKLRDTLCKKAVSRVWKDCLRQLPADGKTGLRIRVQLSLSDPQARYLTALPWELVCSDTLEFLAVDRATPVVREIEGLQRFESLAVDPPLRILVVDAAPGARDQAKHDQEMNRMREALQPLTEAGQVELLRLDEPRPDMLRDALLEKKDFHVLHFMGHGGFNDRLGGAISFIKPDGSKQQVDGEMFADYLKGIVGLRLVVLNSCLSARTAGHEDAPFNLGVASTILERTRIPAVIANQYAITHDAAIDFSRELYGRLAAGEPVDTAITEARMRMRHRSDEWATPVLFLGSQDGKLFDFEPAPGRAKFHEVGLSESDLTPVRLGIRSCVGWAKDMENRTDDVLDLVELFDDRYIRQREWWQERVFPDLREFLLDRIDERRPLLLDFAAHSSIAFAAGWILEAKSGLDIRVRQRTQGDRELEWSPNDGTAPEGDLWLDEPDDIPAPHPTRTPFPAGEGEEAPDVALALAVSQSTVADQVKAYVERKALPVGRILRATIAPEPGPRSVRGGAHALRLAQSLLARVRQRQPHERSGRVHVFAAAPNALVFYLGQLSRSFGRIVLYEHPFGDPNAWGKYQPSIELAKPGKELDESW